MTTSESDETTDAGPMVRKFGGTSVGGGEQIRAVARLIDGRGASGSMVVVSAIAGVTDALVALAQAACRGEHEPAHARLGRLLDLHRRAVAEAGVAGEAAAELDLRIAEAGRRLGRLVDGAALLGDLSPKVQDEVLATGELLSSRILAAALAARGVPVVWVDPRELITTDARYGGAEPDAAAIAANVERRVVPELRRGAAVVTGGYVGRAASGETTTLGRGGSDLSAALLAAALAARELEIWTDVDGVLTADPRRVDGARLVPELSYTEAAELAFFGAKVLHPATIRPAVASGVPVRVRNTFRPNGAGSVIRADVAGAGVTALAARGGAHAIFLGNPRMFLAHGHAARVFAAFDRHGVAVDVIATSEVSISVTLDRPAPPALVRELGELAEVRCESGLAVLSVVGRRLRSTPGVAGRVFGALGEVNVVLISQGASDTNLTFVVREADVEPALRRLHAALFPGAAREAA